MTPSRGLPDGHATLHDTKKPPAIQSEAGGFYVFASWGESILVRRYTCLLLAPLPIYSVRSERDFRQGPRSPATITLIVQIAQGQDFARLPAPQPAHIDGHPASRLAEHSPRGSVLIPRAHHSISSGAISSVAAHVVCSVRHTDPKTVDSRDVECDVDCTLSDCAG